jgi:hypothetical protein
MCRNGLGSAVAKSRTAPTTFIWFLERVNGLPSPVLGFRDSAAAITKKNKNEVALAG